MTPERGQRPKTLFDDLIQLRDEQRERNRTGRSVVRRESLPVEENEFGRMRWYIHPSIKDTLLSTLLFYEIEIPPGGRTGRLKVPGDEVLLLIEGHGYTLIDGVKHPWKAGDAMGLPIRPDGLIIQHVNEDPSLPARLVGARPNTIDSLGVDRGAGFEVLEAAPRQRGKSAPGEP